MYYAVINSVFNAASTTTFKTFQNGICKLNTFKGRQTVAISAFYTVNIIFMAANQLGSDVRKVIIGIYSQRIDFLNMKLFID